MKLQTNTLWQLIRALLAMLGVAQMSAQTITPGAAEAVPQNPTATTTVTQPVVSPAPNTPEEKKKEEETKKEEHAVRLEQMIVEESKMAGYNMGTEVARQDNLQVVDAISEFDVQTLPAEDATDMLKRLPGIEVNYDQGEGGGISIRGTPDIESTLDGREVASPATAGFGGRSLQPEFLPGDILSGVYVYKTQSADQIEGGIGGLLDFKTKQPFDYPADYNGSVTLTGSEQPKSGKLEPNGSIVVGHTWDTKIGKIGVSVGLDYQDFYFVNTFAITGIYNAIPSVFNVPVIAPSSVNPVLAIGGHQRVGDLINVQWAPGNNIVMRGGFLSTRWSEFFAEEEFTFNTPTTNIATYQNSYNLEPGTNILQSGTFANVTASSTALMVPYWVGTKQEFGGMTWTGDRLKLDVSGEATQGYSNELVHLLQFGFIGTVPIVTLNIAGRPPTDVLNAYGADLSNPANYNMGLYLSEATYDLYSQGAERIDLEFKPDIGVWKSLQAGVRFTDRSDSQTGALGVNPLSGLVTSISGLAVPSVTGAAGISSWLTPDPNQMISDDEIRSRLGISPPPLTQNDLGLYYALTQKTEAGYLRALFDFKVMTLDVDGDMGVRFVRTEIDGNSYGALSGGIFKPVSNNSSYGNVLPMATVRVRPPSKKWDLRATGSKTVGRPGVADLDPALTINNLAGTASGGNPGLKPYTAAGGDLTADWYLSKTGYVSVAYFYKSVHGYDESETFSENVLGQTLEVTRPYNGGAGTIQGVETSYNQKFTFLPGRWAGLGLDANFSDIDSYQVDPVTGLSEPIDGIPRDVENLNLYYNLDPWFCRIGLTRQSPTIVGSYPGVLNSPEILGSNLYCDLALQYRFGRMTIMLNVENALQPVIGYYQGKPDTPVNIYNAYRHIIIGARYSF